MGPLAVTAFQAVIPARRKRDKEPGDGSKPATLNTCHTLSAASPVVERRWPSFYQKPDE